MGSDQPSALLGQVTKLIFILRFSVRSARKSQTFYLNINSEQEILPDVVAGVKFINVRQNPVR